MMMAILFFFFFNDFPIRKNIFSSVYDCKKVSKTKTRRTMNNGTNLKYSRILLFFLYKTVVLKKRKKRKS